MQRLVFSFSFILALTGLAGCSPRAIDENDAVLRFSAAVEDAACARAECVAGARRQNAPAMAQLETTGPESNAAQTRCLPEARPFGGGTGSTKDPYLVCSIDHWNRIADAPSRSFELSSDIDFRGTTPRRIARCRSG